MTRSSRMLLTYLFEGGGFGSMDGTDIRAKVKAIETNPGSSAVNALKLISKGEEGSDRDVLNWAFDGSSTGQAEGHDSDVILKPVRIVPDPLLMGLGNTNAFIVLCETYQPNGEPVATNTRRFPTWRHWSIRRLPSS